MRGRRTKWKLPYENIGLSGVYQIRCKSTNRVYIGQSFCCPLRWGKHIADALLRRHHNLDLQNDIIKYGVPDFEFTILFMSAIDTQREEEESKRIKIAKMGLIQPYNIKP